MSTYLSIRKNVLKHILHCGKTETGYTMTILLLQYIDAADRRKVVGRKTENALDLQNKSEKWRADYLLEI